MKELYLVLVLSWLAIAANGEELNCTFSVGETSSYAYSPQEMAKQKFSVSREIHSSREPDNIAEIFRGIEIPTNAGAVFVSAGLTTGLPQENYPSKRVLSLAFDSNEVRIAELPINQRGMTAGYFVFGAAGEKSPERIYYTCTVK